MLVVLAALDPNRFVAEREARWRELEAMLETLTARGGARALGLDGVRKLARAYRAVSGDLLRARAEGLDASITDYLNALVARAYAALYAQDRAAPVGWARFFLRGFPALLRAERRALALSATLLLAGALLGGAARAVDPDARGVLIPEPHAAVTPSERVAEEESGGGTSSGAGSVEGATQFSSFLFTHNIQVSFLVFALGLTAGLGTATLLAVNGAPIGALAVEYHQDGQGTFFWAWILPHGIPELTAIVIAGAAGLVLARGIVAPGRRRRRDALAAEAPRAVRLVVGAMPILVVAGLVEGTISQMHAPVMPYAAKLAFAAILGGALAAWLSRAGTLEDAGLGTPSADARPLPRLAGASPLRRAPRLV